MALVKQALRILEDQAIDEVAETDVARYTVVRVADEVVVDLMARACGVDYAEAVRDARHLQALTSDSTAEVYTFLVTRALKSNATVCA